MFFLGALPGFVAAAEGQDLCNLDRRLKRAEREYQAAATDQAQAQALQQQLGERIRDLNARLAELQARRNALASQGQNTSLVDVHINQTRTNLTTANNQQTQLNTRMATLRTRMDTVATEMNAATDLHQRVKRRFSGLMNCGQLALSIRTFTQSTHNGLSPNQRYLMEGGPRSTVKTQADNLYRRLYQRNLNDQQFNAVGRRMRRALVRHGENYFNSAARLVQSYSGRVGDATTNHWVGRVQRLQQGYRQLVHGRGSICDRMRDYAMEAEKIVWQAQGTLEGEPFNRHVRPQVPMDCDP